LGMLSKEFRPLQIHRQQPIQNNLLRHIFARSAMPHRALEIACRFHS